MANDSLIKWHANQTWIPHCDKCKQIECANAINRNKQANVINRFDFMHCWWRWCLIARCPKIQLDFDGVLKQVSSICLLFAKPYNFVVIICLWIKTRIFVNGISTILFFLHFYQCHGPTQRQFIRHFLLNSSIPPELSWLWFLFARLIFFFSFFFFYFYVIDILPVVECICVKRTTFVYDSTRSCSNLLLNVIIQLKWNC